MVTMCSVSKLIDLVTAPKGKPRHGIFIDSYRFNLFRDAQTSWHHVLPPHQETTNSTGFFFGDGSLKHRMSHLTLGIFAQHWGPRQHLHDSICGPKKPFQPEVIGTSVREQLSQYATVVALLHLEIQQDGQNAVIELLS